MSKIECFSLDGIECVFYSNDHGDPHFHAIKADCWEVRVFFLRVRDQMIEEKRAWKRRGATDLNALKDLAVSHRADLLDEWQSKVQP